MIKNYNLELFLSNYFGKNIKEISEEEFKSLDMLSLDGLDIDGMYEKIDFEEVMSLFPNIKKLVINNYVFKKEDIEIINKESILEYSFYKCDFKSINDMKLFNHAEVLMFERCAFRSYSFLNDDYSNLEVLCLSNPADEEEIDLLNVNTLKIKELYLERCIINNFKAISKFVDLEFINILGTDINSDELLCFVNLDKLSTLFVGEEYVDDEVISSLKEKGIDVKYNVDELLLESEEI
jgi:hypothetical protein